MQLKWQVAASSCYDKWAEMCHVTGSGAFTAAESLSPERTHSTSGGLNSVYLCLGTLFPLYLICKSTESPIFETMRLLGVAKSLGPVLGSAGRATLKLEQIQDPYWAKLSFWKQSRNFHFHKHPNWCEFVDGTVTCFHTISTRKHLDMSNSLNLSRIIVSPCLHYTTFFPSSWCINTDESLKTFQSSTEASKAKDKRVCRGQAPCHVNLTRQQHLSSELPIRHRLTGPEAVAVLNRV